MGESPFDAAQGRPFDSAQGRPFDSAQGRPFDAAQGGPFDAAQGGPSNKDAAQERADQIEAFRAEIRQLQQEGESPFTEAQLVRVTHHQDALLERLASEFDIDRTVTERRLSFGMRLASGFGAATLTAAVVSFIYQFWGEIPTGGQLTLLTAGPVAAVVAMIVAGQIERTRYVAAVMAVVACGAFVLQTMLIGQIFNLGSSPHSLLLWGLFALAVAVPWRFGLPFGLGVLAIVCYAGALMFWSNGFAWTAFLERPEPVLLAAVVLLPAAAVVPSELAFSGRTVLLVVALGALLLLATVAEISMLPWNPGSVRVGYQLLAAVVAVLVIAAGVRRSLDDVVVIGALFGGLFLLTRFVDWWWDWMPKYLFFLILAAVALGWIWALRLLRRHAMVSAA